MSMILALFSEKLASCKTLSIFLLMLKSAGTSCWDERHDFKIQTGWCVIPKERRRKKKETCSFKRGGKKEKEKLWLRGTHDCTQRHTMTHHVVYRAVDSVVLFQQLFYCSGPGNYKPAASSSSSSLLVCFFFLAEEIFMRLAAFEAGRHSLESCTEGFVFPYKGYSDQAIPLLERKDNTTIHIDCSSTVWTAFSQSQLFIESNLTWKLTGGGGFFGSILTTLDSTFGGGRKLFFPTCSGGKHQHWDRKKKNCK